MTKTRSVLCDVCGRDMVDENDCEVVGYSIIIEDLGNYLSREVKYIKETFGKADFKICYVCWIKSLGVKPLAGEGK